MANCLPKELNKQEQRIVNDIMQRSNLNLEDATSIARTMIEWGYTIHEQDYNRLKIALDILKEVVSLNCDKTLETERQFLRLSKGDYELLKEVLYDD